MLTQSDYMGGWIDTTIHDFLSEIGDPTSSMSHALVTCLDSDCNVASLLNKSKHLKGLREKCRVVGKGLLLTTRQLLAADKSDRIFFGFDEVWFFPEADIAAKPPDLVITGPEPLGAQVLDEHAHWLRVNRCSLGLGDGAGMNFCLRVRGVARYIVGAFNDAGLREANEGAGRQV